MQFPLFDAFMFIFSMMRRMTSKNQISGINIPIFEENSIILQPMFLLASIFLDVQIPIPNDVDILIDT